MTFITIKIPTIKVKIQIYNYKHYDQLEIKDHWLMSWH